MFFHNDYAEPGPGVNPDAPEKTGAARLIEILQLECVTLFKLNLLFVASCIPLITIPAAVFAMNQVIRRMILDQTVDCFYHYRLAFQGYWKQAYAAFFLTVLPLFCAGFGAAFYLRRAGSNFLLFLPFMVCSTVFLVTVLASSYFYGVLSTGRGLREALRLALPLGLGKPARAAASALCVYGSLTASLLAFPISLGYLLLIGFSAPCLLGNFFIRTVLREFSPKTPVKDTEKES